MEKEKLILATITGALGGLIAGILIAPDKGSSTRKKIAEESEKYLKEFKDNMEETRQQLIEKAGETKEQLAEFGSNAKKKQKEMDSYKEWTKEKLYNLAKEKNVQGYSQMTKAELIEALKNL